MRYFAGAPVRHSQKLWQLHETNIGEARESERESTMSVVGYHWEERELLRDHRDRRAKQTVVEKALDPSGENFR